MTATTRHPAATLRAIAATAFLHLILLCSVQIGAVTYSPSARADETADQAKQIVEKTDRIRFPRESFQVDVTINSTEADGHTEQRKYRILSRGTEDTLVMTTEPPSERGRIMLLKGRDLWAIMPNVSQPIRLPLAQRLTGQVANGDHARARRVLREPSLQSPVQGRVLHALEQAHEDLLLPELRDHARRAAADAAADDRQFKSGQQVDAGLQRHGAERPAREGLHEGLSQEVAIGVSHTRSPRLASSRRSKESAAPLL